MDFYPTDGAVGTIPESLLWPAVFFVTALGLDLLHAAYGAFLWGAFCRYHEWSKTKSDAPIDSPSYFNLPTLLLFWGKVIAVILAYAQTLDYIHSLIKLP